MAKGNQYLPLSRKWEKGDVITFHLPMKVSVEQIPDKKDYYAFLYGPIVLAASKTKFDLGNDTERKVDTFGDDALKRFDAGLGVGVALEFGRIIAGLDGQFGLVDVEKVGNPKNMNFSIIVGYKF